MALRRLVSGHDVDAHVWQRVPVVAVPDFVDESIRADEAAEALLSERFGFEFTSEIADAGSVGGDRGVVVRWLTARDGRRQLRPTGTRVILTDKRAVFFDDDLAVLDADAIDRHASERFTRFGIGLYLKTSKVWRRDDGWSIEVTMQRHLLDDEFRAGIEEALAPEWRVVLSHEGQIIGRSN